ncbi:MAG: DUF4159 domain-containing protein [Rubellimicrobium sp.]|nr:DUF4159 domain-containing protein [Rubellimicrobium sp.]
MLILGPIGFATPWLLAGLVALPALWVILRAVPPAPVRRRFPGVALLLGLGDSRHESERTPWWLLLLRMLALAALILAFAGPVLSPGPEQGGRGPLLLLADGSWAAARDWDAQLARMTRALDEAGRDGRPVAVVLLTDAPAQMPPFTDAGAAAATLGALVPRPWEPDAATMAAFGAALSGGFDTLWLSDGLARAGRDDLLARLRAQGAVTVMQSPAPVLALRPALADEGALTITVLRSPAGPATDIALTATGPDPAGTPRLLAETRAHFDAGATEATARLVLPPELRNRITRIDLPEAPSAGGTALSDDSLRRREIALVAARGAGEALDLVSPLHYLRQALLPGADLIGNLPLGEVIPANPDVIILADVATLPPDEAAALRVWVEGGGMLVRFAGPHLAGADFAALAGDPLLPVRLRAGGRSLGGTMSWGEPRAIAPFAETSPFHGLRVPADVSVRAQVMAEPGPDLAGRVIAKLTDGTPLVTRATLGAGQVVLFHVTANAEWSSIPLSGLFVQMLDRLAVSSGGGPEGAADLEGTTWVASALLDAWGGLTPTGAEAGVSGERIAAGPPGPDLPPGLYAGADRRLAVNVIEPDRILAPARWPEGVTIEGPAPAAQLPLAGWLLALAVGLLVLDAGASALLFGPRVRAGRAGRAGRMAVLVAGLLAVATVQAPAPLHAQAAAPPDPAAEALALAATAQVVLAYVETGDERVDALSRAGLTGLGAALRARTAVEPGPPMAVDPGRDEIAFFPLIYWPITADAPLPSAAAYQRLNRYLQSGGMILFDTRDAGMAGIGDSSPEGQRLRAIAAPLDIPPLAPVPADHILTRTFYLLEDFPGRYATGTLWAEAPPPDAELAEGMPFRNLNDGVTPVVIGGNDWAAAWAVNDHGEPLVPVGRGAEGERQREMALRFGINLVMHVLTGNYKSDQVHVADLIERLGQ